MTLTFSRRLKPKRLHTMENCVGAIAKVLPAAFAFSAVKGSSVAPARRRTTAGALNELIGSASPSLSFFLFFFFCCSGPAHQQTGRCRRIQMSDEVMSLSRRCAAALWTVSNVSHLMHFIAAVRGFHSVGSVWFVVAVCLKPYFIWLVVISPVCPSVPETLNL